MARHLPDLVVAEPSTPEELADVVTQFGRSGIGTIGVAGGDGTIREVLTALARHEGGYRPDIALIPAGRTNLASLALGSAEPGPTGLLHLCDVLRTGTARRIMVPVLDIAWPGGEHPDVRGLLFGAAAFRAATELANRRIHRFGLNDRAVITATLSLTVLALLCGRGGTMRRGVRMIVATDEGQAEEGKRFMLLATSLQRFLPGLSPFWGEGEGRLRWLDVAAPPRRLATALLPTLRGRPRPWMAEAGYRSGRAGRMRLWLDKPFIVDGEPYPAGSDGILLSCTECVGFVSP